VFFCIIPLEKKKLAYLVQEFLSFCLVVATVCLVFLDLLLFLIKKKVNLYLRCLFFYSSYLSLKFGPFDCVCLLIVFVFDTLMKILLNFIFCGYLLSASDYIDIVMVGS
jgi:hypothetical protein